MNTTPLRYPGGKSIMTPFFIDLLRVNDMRGVTYAEPYAGGAGTATNLLLNDNVDRILINDASICIYSFWKYIKEENERFIDSIINTPVNLEQWKHFHNLIRTAQDISFELGFATFFLSRTNRSGILTAGPIGGSSEEKQEKATYKIDCRFNKEDLIKRIARIGERSADIEVCNLDAIDFLQTLNIGNNLVYLDPPYFEQGKSLYLNYYGAEDHQVLANFLSEVQNFKWVLSYDNVEAIRTIYNKFDLYEFTISYTAQQVKRGSELLTHSPELILPEELSIRRKSSDITLNRVIY
jgi:DNA adenine methylase